jgi:hypothetical protein
VLDSKRHLIFPPTIVFQNAVLSDNDKISLEMRAGSYTEPEHATRGLVNTAMDCGAA